MDYQMIEGILGQVIGLTVGFSIGMIIIFIRKKRPFAVLKVLLAIFIQLIVLLGVRNLPSFGSLEKAVGYYDKDMRSNLSLVGEETALVPKISEEGIELFLFNKKSEKWKFPNDLLYKNHSHKEIIYTEDAPYITEFYTIDVRRDGDGEGYYVSIMDLTRQYSLERQVKDSEKSVFRYISYAEEDVGQSVYYTYLKKLPENYKLYIDGEEVLADWDRLFSDERSYIQDNLNV